MAMLKPILHSHPKDLNWVAIFFLTALLLTFINLAASQAQDKSQADIWIEDYFIQLDAPCPPSQDVDCIKNKLLKLHEKGNIFACLLLMNMFHFEPEQAKKWAEFNRVNNTNQVLIELARTNAKAMMLLSMLYADGTGGFEKNEKQALALATQALEMGEDKAGFIIFEIMSRTNPAEAEIWLNKFLEKKQD